MAHIKETILKKLEKYNEAYRNGNPLVSDHEYDSLLEELKKLDPKNPYLQKVEPEKFESKKLIRHPTPMLSLEKAYLHKPKEFELFALRVKKEAAEIGISNTQFRVTAKLDGLAGRDDGKVFVTRGNGEFGYEISSAFDKGVIAEGGRGLGSGEIVVVKSYFEEHMAEDFEHPRNMVVGIISSDVVNEKARKALEDEAVRFVPYVTLKSFVIKPEVLLYKIEEIGRELQESTDYPVDGTVVEVIDERVRAHMGSTTHHYRWQIAVKTKGETAVTKVEAVRWQVGRSGNITPVMEVVPVSLSGATIRRVTAHNAGKIRDGRIGPGAEIEIIRSGEVIPKLENVILPSDKILIPDKCPSCDAKLEWKKDFLQCTGLLCSAQTVQRIYHWFKTIGNADWFGIKTIERLVEKGFDSLEKIYAMSEENFINTEFGPVQSRNLYEAIQLSKTRPVEDWRFLAALGISALGTGDSRKLLAHFRLEEITRVSRDDIKNIYGFGDITSRSIAEGLSHLKDTINHMLNLGFNLERTPLETETQKKENFITGKGIVFTGKMSRLTREEMESDARRLGARVQTSVSGKTDYLVCGESAGKSKLKKAEETRTKVITEREYFEMIKE